MPRLSSMLHTLAMYVHDIDPYAIMLWEGGPIRWYGLSYLVGFVIGWLLVRRVLTHGKSTFQPQQAMDIIVTLAIGIVVGGRVGYGLFYEPRLLYTFSDSLPFWNLLALNKGGMASHGGMIGMLVAGIWLAKRAPGGPHRIPHVLDLGAFGAPLGLGIGRIANFINGELYGRIAPASSPIAVKFPQEMQRWESTDPRIDGLRNIVPGGETLAPWQVVDRVIAMVQSGNPVAKAAVEPLLNPRYPSQLFQAIGEGIVLALVLLILWYRPRKPLVVGGMFCATYGVQRIVVEQFRMPDAQIGYTLWGLTRGQWLSVWLTLAGVIITVIAATRKTEKLGGWGGPRIAAS